MDAAQDPGYLRTTQTAVREFRSRFREFLTLHAPTNESGIGRGVIPAVIRREGVTPEQVTEIAEQVAEAAGRARRAAELTKVMYTVEGQTRPIDPIAAWSTIAQPKPVLEPENVLIACGQIIGSLDEMIEAAKIEQPRPAGPAEMHPTVWGAARPLWDDGHYREAVAAAAEALADKVKTLVKRRDIAETSVWQHAFSNAPAKPGEMRLRWPGEPDDRDVKSMNDGLRLFAPGAQMTIRNGAAHSTERMSEQDALERLGALSLLARWVDTCERVEGPQ
ncbi:TIGR02391 family protein [Nocardia cyriacigeorgica]|uniref:TIGR02391 family protein n=1 Tax=Nocardia cyriacigeorgica TaxID=135487 RepID=A0A5R8P802_9NOCA|nr:TIGR02391 family protein [Nocardia cyriacigeorgica]TLG00307.1 TIGR02391 family protein [Nocardia cyriacigeorgica]